MVVLYGRLEVVVVEAVDLPNLDNSVLRPEDKSDPYCLIEVQSSSGGTSKIGKTYTIDDCLNPKWYFKVAADLNQDVAGIRFTVKDRDLVSSEIIGSCFLPVHTFLGDNNAAHKAELTLVNTKGFQAGSLRVTANFTSSSGQPDPTFGDRAHTKASEFRDRVSRKLPRYGDPNSFGDMAFLHGILDLKLERANNLPNLDSSILSLRKKDVSDPFVVVSLEDVDGEPWKVATTHVIDNDLSPVWDETFRVDVCHDVSSITFTVRDKDFISSEQIGSVSFPVTSLTMGNGVSGTFDLLRENKNKRAGTLTLSMTYHPKHSVDHTYEVPECIFPLRHDNEVRLYQDAHCPSLPLALTDDYGNAYQPRSTWKDIYTTLMEATQFIYIVGWSVSAKIALQRDDGDDNRSLGEILKQKAYEGVRVRLLLWDELTSNDLRKQGAMSTEDEETSNFFKGTSVVVVLAPRDRHTKDMFSTKTHFTSLCYSHHQKCVIADSPIPEAPGRKKVVAFVGGLDLASGRYDNPTHNLFNTLVKEHKKDFRNKVFPTLTSANGPREPWHDIHSRIEGPAAHDVLMNFISRWQKQASDYIASIVPLEQMDGIDVGYRSISPSRWSVQVFRSINSDSAYFDWSSATGLTKKKGRAFDNSLHRAYIHQIRRARCFIYIENQYFMGSSHMWGECRDAKAGNLVPLEIATKIEEKIRNGERFVAYICIPMFPEGKPADKVTQEMLHWQYRTIQMMYARVAAAIKQAGLVDAHPLDYLIFLCLGRKEPQETVPQELVAPEDPSTTLAFANRRLMIYVHSKMAIFDDEYIIVGSANINDRSLSGNRDTEIAMGSYQPMHVGAGCGLARGDVSMFRRGLWAEHFGQLAPVHSDPSSVECVRTVRWLAEESLKVFMQPGEAPTPYHMLLYPLQVNVDGTVTPRPDCPTFPDTVGSVIGARSKVFPSSLTT